MASRDHRQPRHRAQTLAPPQASLHRRNLRRGIARGVTGPVAAPRCHRAPSHLHGCPGRCLSTPPPPAPPQRRRELRRVRARGGVSCRLVRVTGHRAARARGMASALDRCDGAGSISRGDSGAGATSDIRKDLETAAGVVGKRSGRARACVIGHRHARSPTEGWVVPLCPPPLPLRSRVAHQPAFHVRECDQFKRAGGGACGGEPRVDSARRRACRGCTCQSAVRDGGHQGARWVRAVLWSRQTQSIE